MKLKSSLLTSLFIVAATTSQADTILFNDTYNVSTNSDAINFELSTRQAAGAITGSYTGTSANDVDENEFKTYPGSAALGANFAAGIGANDFTQSIDGRITTDIAWVAFSMVSFDQSTRGATDLTFRISGDDKVYIGGPNITTLNQATIQNLDTSLASWDSSESYTYAFEATAADAQAGTFNFTINDIVVASNISYAFTDVSTRTLRWDNFNTGVGVWDNVTLTVIPESKSFAMIGGLFALGSVVLFRGIS
ncbi:hypothetical protein ACWPKO_15265 [Coraliomargarita sp. W4R53]